MFLNTADCEGGSTYIETHWHVCQTCRDRRIKITIPG